MKIRRAVSKIILILVPIFMASFTACGQNAETAISPTLSPTYNEFTKTPTVTAPETVQVVSAYGPVPPINPGGPAVIITLKNVADVPIVSLTATLELNNRSFEFDFVDTTDNPLPPGATASAKSILIGGGFDHDSRYVLTISGTLQGIATFTVFEQVQIAEPPEG